MFINNGRDISKEINEIINSNSPGEIRVAVAYWGEKADFDLKENFRIVCDLDSGNCNPSVIKYFWDKNFKKIKNLPKLHAKVVFSNEKAVVSSANISTNGLGEKNSNHSGSYEAGYSTKLEEDLCEISKWFEELWEKSCFITDEDLNQAKEDWDSRSRGTPKLIPETLNPFELLEERIDRADRLRACRSNILDICQNILHEDNLKKQEVGKISTWAIHLLINSTGKTMNYGKGLSRNSSAGQADNQWIYERIKKHSPEKTKNRVERILNGLVINQYISKSARIAASLAVKDVPWKST